MFLSSGLDTLGIPECQERSWLADTLDNHHVASACGAQRVLVWASLVGVQLLSLDLPRACQYFMQSDRIRSPSNVFVKDRRSVGATGPVQLILLRSSPQPHPRRNEMTNTLTSRERTHIANNDMADLQMATRQPRGPGSLM